MLLIMFWMKLRKLSSANKNLNQIFPSSFYEERCHFSDGVVGRIEQTNFNDNS